MNSFVGLFNTVFLLPFIPILHVLGIETFQLPTRREEWVTCAINMVITLSSDYLYVLSMLKTTPLGKSAKCARKCIKADILDCVQSSPSVSH